MTSYFKHSSKSYFIEGIHDPDTTQDTGPFFKVFNEIGIIDQLGRTILEARLFQGPITPHFTVLNHLMRVADGRAPMEMARAFQVPKTSMTHTLKGLETHGLIETRPNPEDGRSKPVWLTQAGRDLRAQVIAGLAPEFVKLAQGFDASRLPDICPVLTDLRKYLDAARD